MTNFKKLLIFLCITIFSFNLTLGWSEDEAYVDKFQNYDYLRSIAKNNDSVKVIAKLDVPGIEEFTSESNKFKTGSNDASFQQDSLSADMELEYAISAVSRYLLLRL